ncbi:MULTISPECIES: DUF1963 domain-containing protein [Streptomycetaceae]|uniref:DUF1963 domain-containing protein n=2 Tax=Kitasatosporales TaxID=85011 RepID=UPI0002140163|nr:MULTISPECIES: DUF1963 domain-containing protein [Streptomycetaceae]MYS62468.1 DUF1963 domain-containing protein [Streptomyces sp. SID5468]CCB78390.1 conserved protein of unknown function [Streptantibioticus cattleyicolor NRRL 8057 = DSM 46488]
MDRRQEFRARSLEKGVPGHIVDEALQLALPRVELRPPGHNNGPVAGRYGGLPSLPADVEWSGFPHFIASVDCAALPPGALDFPLPADGHLLFFGTMDEPEWGEDSEDTEGFVLHVPAGTVTAERRPAGKHAEFVREPFPLHMHVDWNMPVPGHDVIESHEERRLVWEEYEDGLWSDTSGAGELTLGGYACPAYDDPCLPPYPGGDDQPWRLLAQARVSPISREPIENTVFWLMRPEDLAEGRFEKAKVRLELVPPA